MHHSWYVEVYTSLFSSLKLIMSTTSLFSSFSIYNKPQVIICITFWWNSSHSLMSCLIVLWQKLSLFLEPNLFFVGKHSAYTNMSYNLFVITLKTFSFFLPNSTTFTPPLLEAWLGRRLELMLRVSSKVIHSALNNCKSFLLNDEQVSILWPRFLAWYSYVRWDFWYGCVAPFPLQRSYILLSSFAYISPKGISKGEIFYWLLW